MTQSKGLKYRKLPQLNSETVKDIFHYNSDEGILRWKMEGVKVKPGQTVGSPDKYGRLRTTYNYHNYLVYHIIWLYMTGAWPGQDIDHIDRNSANNKWNNLREVSHSRNMLNCGPRLRNGTGVKGVFFDKTRRKYLANIMLNGKTIHIGRYNTIEEAELARKNKEIELYGGDIA